MSSGEVSDLLTAVSRLALAAWAYLELVDGGNLVRRMLGLGALVYLALTLSGIKL